MPRILVFTASMGEGHNTAARATASALQARGAETLVADPYSRTNPVVNRLMQKGYAVAINRYPRAWKLLFDMLGKPGVVEGMQPILLELRRAILSHVREFQPQLLVSTYPVFAFLIAKLRRTEPSLPPLYTIITDSTRINPAWYRWMCDGFIVADSGTAEVLRAARVPEERIHPLGFPLPEAFSNLQPAPPPENGPWKVIFFPGGGIARAAATLRRLGELGIEVTVVTGRRNAVHSALNRLQLPVRGQLLGWTQEMPTLMSTHHVFIGKAGGATVQEAIAAKIPFVVSHVVPGQEEGNIALIERRGIGTLAAGAPERVADVLQGAFCAGGRLWRAWRSNLEDLAGPPAAPRIADFLLSKIPQ